MICVFTQTYGDKRSELFDWKIRDTNLSFFVQQFDHSILSFHNSSENFKNETLKKYDIYDEVMTFDGISYPECLRRILDFVKKNHFKKLIFLQDDVFTMQKDKSYYEELASFIKNTHHDMINLEIQGNDKVFPVLQKAKNFVLFDTNNHDLKKIDPNYWYFDDGTYAANISFLDEIYDEQYFSENNIWSAEHILNHKMYFKKIPRYVLDKKSFTRCNLLGPNNNREQALKWLNEQFPISA
jgi:hypothetical protein